MSNQGTDFRMLLPPGGMELFFCLVDSSCKMLGLDAVPDNRWHLVLPSDDVPAYIRPTSFPKFRSGSIGPASLPASATGMIITAFSLESLTYGSHVERQLLEQYAMKLYQSAARCHYDARRMIEEELGKKVSNDGHNIHSIAGRNLGPASAKQCRFRL